MPFSTVETIYSMRQKYIPGLLKEVIFLEYGERYLIDEWLTWLALREIWTRNSTATLHRTVWQTKTAALSLKLGIALR